MFIFGICLVDPLDSVSVSSNTELSSWGSVPMTHMRSSMRRKTAPSQLLGKTLRQTAEQQLASSGPDDSGTVPENLEQLVAELRQQRYELQVHQIELELQNQQLQQAQLSLEQAYQEYADLFDSAPVGYLILEANGLIQRANLQAAHQLGRERVRLGGWRFLAFLEGSDASSFTLFLRRVFTLPGQHRIELSLPRSGAGLVFQLEGEKFPGDEGMPERCRLTMTDITAQRQAQEEVLRLNMDLERRVEQRTSQLGEVNRELEMMMHAVMHDLQTPLRQIRSVAEMMVRAEDQDQRQRYVQYVEESSVQMDQLLFALQDYFRAGQQQLHFQDVELGRVVQHVWRDAAPALKDREIVLSQDPMPLVYGDPLALQLVLTHLIGNALKFTRGCAPARVHVSARRNDREIIIGVQDNGIGFNMRQKGRLFGVFQRLHTVSDFTGTGMGLALVRRMIHRHGGRAWAESKPNQGATFWVSLPVQGMQ